MSLFEQLKSLALSAQECGPRLERIRADLDPRDAAWIQEVAQVLPQLVAALEEKNLTLRKLQRRFFGKTSEKTKDVCPESEGGASTSQSEVEQTLAEEGPDNKLPEDNPPEPKDAKKKNKAPGHGRRGVDAYTGANWVRVPHPDLQPGCRCPGCQKGQLYDTHRPQKALHLKAAPPISATVHEKQTLRCNGCGKTYAAPTPPQASTQTYDPSVGVMGGILRFGSGMPFYRLEALQESFGVPLPASIQWEQADQAANIFEPVWDHLVHTAAQAPNLSNDDTTMRVEELRRQIKDEAPPKRTGIFTTAIVAEGNDHPIVLFFTGRKHAGENLQCVLEHRNSDLPPPIQMCDALAHNLPKQLLTIVSNCLAHARREFVDLAPKFPDSCRRVLESLGQVYGFDAKAKEMFLGPHERLVFHQLHSQPVMVQLKQWLDEQIDNKIVEPNSTLGNAIKYMRKHWEKLTRFLTVAGARLDNNLTEQILKRAIIHRKNSLGYKTQRGAKVGDLFMSLIHTCKLNRINPFDYLMALVNNPQKVKAQPANWMPWNFRQALDPDPLPNTS